MEGVFIVAPGLVVEVCGQADAKEEEASVAFILEARGRAGAAGAAGGLCVSALDREQPRGRVAGSSRWS